MQVFLSVSKEKQKHYQPVPLSSFLKFFVILILWRGWTLQSQLDVCCRLIQVSQQTVAWWYRQLLEQQSPWPPLLKQHNFPLVTSDATDWRGREDLIMSWCSSSHTALQTLSLAVISAEKATILNVSTIKFLCPDLPLAFCMITALAPACGIKNKGTQLFFCVSLKKSMQQNWTSTSGNQHSRAEVNASLHQLRGWSHCTALRGFTFPMDDDKIHSSNSYIKVKQMKQKIERTVYPKGSA